MTLTPLPAYIWADQYEQIALTLPKGSKFRKELMIEALTAGGRISKDEIKAQLEEGSEKAGIPSEEFCELLVKNITGRSDG